MNIIKEQEPVKKNTRAIIAEYVDRKDLHGLAEFARAMMEDSMNERSQLLQEIEERVKEEEDTNPAMESDMHDCGLHTMKQNILTIITSLK